MTIHYRMRPYRVMAIECVVLSGLRLPCMFAIASSRVESVEYHASAGNTRGLGDGSTQLHGTYISTWV